MVATALNRRVLRLEAKRAEPPPFRPFLWHPGETREEAMAAAGLAFDDEHAFAIRLVGVAPTHGGER